EESGADLSKLLPALELHKLQAKIADWKLKYPAADEPTTFIAPFAHVSGGGLRWRVYLLRPKGGYDPELLVEPPIAPGTKQAKMFAAALELFFPGWVFDNLGHDAASAKLGSMTSAGPFPYWRRMVSEEMVNFA